MINDERLAAIEIAKIALSNISNSYWKTTDEKLHQNLIDLALNTHDLITELNQGLISSTTSEFASIGSLVNKNILPQIKIVQKQIDTIVGLDGIFKEISSDLVKLSSSLTFLQVGL